MPVELQVIRASEFVRLDPREHLDFEASTQVLKTLALACRKRGLDRALLDLRTLPVPPKPLFTPRELGALVSVVREGGFSRRQRLAVLYRYDVYGGVRNFAFFSRMRGLDVQAFTDFEAALEWLSEARRASVERPEPGVSVSITKRQAEIRKLPVVLPARTPRPAVSPRRPTRTATAQRA